MPYTDHYSPDEFALVAGTRTSYRRTSRRPAGGNYESHQPCTHSIFCRDKIPVGRYEISLARFDADFRAARYSYALRVLEAAHARTLEKYPDWLDHEWVIEELGWRQLHFSSPQRRQAEDYCDSLVREIANSGEIAVSELLEIKSVNGKKEVLLIRNVAEFDKATADPILKGIKKRIMPLIRPGNLSLGYEEISCHIVRLDERMLSLLNAEDGWPPLTEAERELFTAANHMDKRRMEVALANGANINSLGDAESVLAHAIAALDWDALTGDAADDCVQLQAGDDATEQQLAVIDWLLDSGADINLFGFEGLSPLSAAVLRHEPKLVRYLLSRGADPTSNQFPEDSISEPTACYYASGDLHCVYN